MTTVPRGTVVTECVWNLDGLLVAGLGKSRSTGDDDQEDIDGLLVVGQSKSRQV